MIINGNSLEVLKTFDDNSVDAIVTDPPYHLVSIVKRFGKEGSAPAKFGKDGSFGRLSKGFMGKDWDGVDENGQGIAYNVDLWKEAFRVLKPGGHLLAFGGTRTYHRMAVAIEDAGFEVRDMLEWIYASGFPKSLNVGKAVDKLQGNEREVVGDRKAHNFAGAKGSMMTGHASLAGQTEIDITKGSSEWEGFGTALKPAHEPIVMARKPLSEKTIVENVLKHGTGAIDIDGCRIPTSEDLNYGTGEKSNVGFKTSPQNNKRPVYDGQGRFPANICVTGDALNDGVMQKSGKAIRSNSGGNTFGGENKKPPMEDLGFSDSGSKSRYFDIDVWAEKHGLKEDKFILDACCGGRMFWFDKKHDNVLYVDKRKRDTGHCKHRKNHSIQPDEIVDFKNMPYADKTFKMVVFDPPHIFGKETGNMTKQYGWLEKDTWRDEIKKGFDECWRVLDYYGSLIFKWNENTISKKEILDLIEKKPLFGHQVGGKMETHWLCFMKLPEQKDTFNQDVWAEKYGLLQFPKASKRERNEGCEGLEEKKANYLTDYRPRAEESGDKGQDTPYAGTNRSGGAKNNHPTVKPVHLMSWLVRLVSKEGDTVLDPFNSSGTTGVACKKLGRSYIGIELDPEYVKISEARINAVEEDKQEKLL